MNRTFWLPSPGSLDKRRKRCFLRMLFCALLFPLLAPTGKAGGLESVYDFTLLSQGGFRNTMQTNHPYPALAPAIGSGHNSYAWSMAWYDDDGAGPHAASLYVGTVRDVLCAAGVGTPLTDPCPPITGIGFGPDQRAEIWRYDPSPYIDYGGTNGHWTRVYQSPFNDFPSFLFNDVPRDVGYRNQSVCKTLGDNRERLYATTSGIPGNILYINDIGTSFLETSHVGLKAAYSNFRPILGSDDGDIGYRGLACFNGYLITSPASSVDSGSEDVSENPFLLANADPAKQNGSVSDDWLPLVDFRNFPGIDYNRDGDFSDTGIGDCVACGLGTAAADPSNYGAFDMRVLNGDLWVAVSNRGKNSPGNLPDRGGVELWRGDGTNFGFKPDGSVMGDGSGIVWNKVIDAGAGRREDNFGPDVDNALATFGILDGKLYMAMWESGFESSSRAELIRVTPNNPGSEEWELLIGGGRLDYASGYGTASGQMVCNAENQYEDLTPAVGNVPGDASDCYPSTGRNMGFGPVQALVSGTGGAPVQFDEAIPPNPIAMGNATYFWRLGPHLNAESGLEELYMGTYSSGSFESTSCGGSILDPCEPNTVDGGFELYKTSSEQAGNEWYTLSTQGFENPLNYGVRSILSVQLPDAPTDEPVLFIGTANAYTNAPDVPGTEAFWGGTEIYMSGHFEPVAEPAECNFFIIPGNSGKNTAICL